MSTHEDEMLSQVRALRKAGLESLPVWPPEDATTTYHNLPVTVVVDSFLVNLDAGTCTVKYTAAIQNLGRVPGCVYPKIPHDLLCSIKGFIQASINFAHNPA